MINILNSKIQDAKKIWIDLPDYFFIWLTPAKVSRQKPISQ
jgi:hypothetical protein